MSNTGAPKPDTVISLKLQFVPFIWTQHTRVLEQRCSKELTIQQENHQDSAHTARPSPMTPESRADDVIHAAGLGTRTALLMAQLSILSKIISKADAFLIKSCQELFKLILIVIWKDKCIRIAILKKNKKGRLTLLEIF